MATMTAPAKLPELTKDDLSRYSRHLILPEVGMEGQRKLKAARVLCVGTGGLGSPLAFYLAAAGIGTLGLVDFDVVDASNLQRQIIHSHQRHRPQEARLRRRKAHARSIPHMNIVKHDTMLTERQRPRDPQGLRHRRRRHRQLPHPLPGQRRLRAARQAQRLRLDLPLRRPGQRLRHRSTAPAIAASIPSRRRRAWCPAAPRAACSASCPAWSA